jgi:hypothetical protein
VVHSYFIEMRFLLTADILGIEAAGVKAASGWGIDWAGDISFEDYPVPGNGGVGYGRCRKESLGIRVERSLVDLFAIC